MNLIGQQSIPKKMKEMLSDIWGNWILIIENDKEI
jgi:hypothetical protein